MHAISSYRGNRPTHTHTHTHKQTHRQDRLQYTALLSLACSVIIIIIIIMHDTFVNDDLDQSIFNYFNIVFTVGHTQYLCCRNLSAM